MKSSQWFYKGSFANRKKLACREPRTPVSTPTPSQVHPMHDVLRRHGFPDSGNRRSDDANRAWKLSGNAMATKVCSEMIFLTQRCCKDCCKDSRVFAVSMFHLCGLEYIWKRTFNLFYLAITSFCTRLWLERFKELQSHNFFKWKVVRV